MKKERIIIILSSIVVLLLITTVMGVITTAKMSKTAAYHNAVQHRMEKVLINIDESYSDSITAIKNQEYNRLCK